jgi:L-asparaginase II
VVRPGGDLLARVGSERLETFLRSAAKPFQAMPLLVAGGAERFSLSSADLALICASHSGTAAHVERVVDLLRRGGLELSRLRCGVHRPFDEESAVALDRAGEAPTTLHNNCSGKHAGMLLACRLLDLPLASYLELDHPLHRMVLGELSAVCGVAADEIAVGVDGCSAPCFAISLESAARAYAALADPASSGLSAERVTLLRTVADAMTGHPEMVAGPGTFTTRLMEVTRGRLLGKEGAQGVYAIAVRGPVALGLVLKIADGWDRARSSVVLDLLRQLGSLSREEFDELAPFYQPAIYNRRGLEVGRVVSRVELEQVAATAGEPS